MNAIVSRSEMSPRRLAGAYLAEARSECLRYLRNPGFMLPLVLFPCVFYLMFGVAFDHGGADVPRYLLASYGTFGVMVPGLFGFGVSLALERDNGLLTLKRALPMPPAAYLVGKMVMAMAASALVIVLLEILAVTVAGVALSPLEAVALVATGAFGTLPFCALGMWIGTLIKGQGAPGLINLVYLPMSFLSGLWIPLPMLPEALRNLAPVWPSYHLAAIGLHAVGIAAASPWPHVAVLAAFTAVFLALAARRLRRNG